MTITWFNRRDAVSKRTTGSFVGWLRNCRTRSRTMV